MRYFLKYTMFIFSILFVFSCSSIKYVPTNTDTHIEYRDSVIYKVDTLRIPVPVETVKEVVPPMDTLKMETSVAEAKAWVDTATNALKGVLKNKKTALSQPQVVYKERIQYRDSLVTKEVPVEVEKVVEKRYVPFIWKLLGSVGILALLYLALKIYFKLGKV